MLMPSELEIIRELVRDALLMDTALLGEMREQVGCGYHPMEVAYQEKRVIEMTALQEKLAKES